MIAPFYHRRPRRFAASNVIKTYVSPIQRVSLTRTSGSATDNVTGALERFANGAGKPDADFLREAASARIVCVAGNRPDEFAERFEEARRSLLLRQAPSAADSLHPVPDGEGERLLPAILEGPGGLGDLERAALGLRLQYGESHPDVAGGDGPAAVLKKAGEAGILESGTAEELAEAAGFLLGVECVLSLVDGGEARETPWEDAVKATVARACDAGDFEEVVAKAEKAAARIAAYPVAAQEPGGG